MSKSRVPSVRGAQALVARIDFGPDAIEAAKEKLIELLDAKQIVRARHRNPQGGIAYEEVPCVSVQLAAAVKILEFGVGTPAPMVAVEPPKTQKAAKEDLGNLLAEHPKIIAAVLEQMKASIEARQAIDVTPQRVEVGEKAQENES